MTQDFPHFYTAIDWTLKYYSIYTIKNEFELIGEYGYGGANHKHVQDSYDLVLELHRRMEAEIKNTIQNCYPSTQVLHLEILKEWLEDFRIIEINKPHIEDLINNYNQDLYSKLLIDTEQREKEYRKNPYYHLKHGDEYTYEKEKFRYTGIMRYPTGETETVIEKNNKFFCLDKSPEYLDPKYLSTYIDRVDKLVSNFRRIIKKYVNLYDTGKLPVHQQLVIVSQPLPANENAPKQLPQPLVHPTKMLKAKLTIAELAYLFKLLNDEGLIEAQYDTHIQKFILDSFDTPNTASKAKSKKNIANLFSTPSQKTKDFWRDYFRAFIGK